MRWIMSNSLMVDLFGCREGKYNWLLDEVPGTGLRKTNTV